MAFNQTINVRQTIEPFSISISYSFNDGTALRFKVYRAQSELRLQCLNSCPLNHSYVIGTLRKFRPPSTIVLARGLNDASS